MMEERKMQNRGEREVEIDIDEYRRNPQLRQQALERGGQIYRVQQTRTLTMVHQGHNSSKILILAALILMEDSRQIIQSRAAPSIIIHRSTHILTRACSTKPVFALSGNMGLRQPRPVPQGRFCTSAAHPL